MNTDLPASARLLLRLLAATAIGCGPSAPQPSAPPAPSPATTAVAPGNDRVAPPSAPPPATTPPATTPPATPPLAIPPATTPPAATDTAPPPATTKEAPVKSVSTGGSSTSNACYPRASGETCLGPDTASAKLGLKADGTVKHLKASAGSATTCCYEVTSVSKGRALLVGAQPRVAPLQARPWRSGAS